MGVILNDNSQKEEKIYQRFHSITLFVNNEDEFSRFDWIDQVFSIIFLSSVIAFYLYQKPFRSFPHGLHIFSMISGLVFSFSRFALCSLSSHGFTHYKPIYYETFTILMEFTKLSIFTWVILEMVYYYQNQSNGKLTVREVVINLVIGIGFPSIIIMFWLLISGGKVKLDFGDAELVEIRQAILDFPKIFIICILLVYLPFSFIYVQKLRLNPSEYLKFKCHFMILLLITTHVLIPNIILSIIDYFPSYQVSGMWIRTVRVIHNHQGVFLAIIFILNNYQWARKSNSFGRQNNASLTQKDIHMTGLVSFDKSRNDFQKLMP